MSDGGSDFTSQAFRPVRRRAAGLRRKCRSTVEWVDRTLKYEWIFRQVVREVTELRVQCAQFQQQYNTERLHTALRCAYPWVKLGAAVKRGFTA
ncbi:integrase core domain-containing protein [Deinococcus aerolatus]|uniref:integrase core domain-containing protein n=1 Tax=Deinococcus aerolatus TaxID=522487 RepID=UPI003570FCAD